MSDLLREILQLGDCPNQEEEQLVTMTATEALRLQLDNLQKENQELEVRILKLSQEQPDAVAVRDIERDRDHWKEECERLIVENAQLRALYEELLKHTSVGIYPVDSAKGCQTMVGLQEQLQQEQVSIQQWRRK